ncbi:unnamed protein product [Chrysoparadoxa australica]
MLLSRLGIDKETLAALSSLATPISSVEALLDRAPQQLANELGVTAKSMYKLRYQVAKACMPPPIAQVDEQAASAADHRLATFETAADLYRQAVLQGGYCMTGSPALDELLKYGILGGVVTEVTGHTAAGKSQLCMSLAAGTANKTHVLYIDTTNTVSPERIAQMAQAQRPEESPEAALANVHVLKCFDAFSLLKALDAFHVQVEAGQGPLHLCRLLIVDSVTAVVSSILGGEGNITGRGLMAAVGQALNAIALRHQTAVMVWARCLIDSVAFALIETLASLLPFSFSSCYPCGLAILVPCSQVVNCTVGDGGWGNKAALGGAPSRLDRRLTLLLSRKAL